MNKIYPIAILVLAAALLLAVFPKRDVNLGSSFGQTFSSATNTTSSITITPSVIVGSDALRAYVSVCTTDVNPIFICLQTATSTCTDSAGIRLSGVLAATSTVPTCFESATYKGDIVARSAVSTTSNAFVSIVK